MKDRRKFIVLGLDGATWDLLRPLMAGGVMPNLARMTENGASGILNSTTPSNSAVAWTSLVTGQNPGKHGVYDFIIRSDNPLQNRWLSTGSIRSATIWNLLNAAGLSAGILNLPILYPPEKVEGYMVAGMMAPTNAANITYPEGLYGELLGNIGEYMVEPPAMDPGAILHATRKRRDALKYLMKEHPTDFLLAVFEAPDRIQHNFWSCLNPEDATYDASEASKHRDVLLECYAMLDGTIGDILAGMDSSTYLFVVSDHGFGPVRQYFYMDRFLADIGLLKYDRIRWFWTKSRQHLGVRRKYEILGGQNKGLAVADDRYSYMDMQGSAAFVCRPCEPMVLMNRRRSSLEGQSAEISNFDELRNLAKDKVLQVINPGTNRPVVKRVLFPEEIYSGPQVKNAPELILVMDDPACIAVTGIPLRPGLSRRGYLGKADPRRGYHRDEGILAAAGEGIKPGTDFSASIMDVTPTVLYLMGAPVPEDMDGQVISQLLDAEFLAGHPVGYSRASQGESQTDADSEVYTAGDSEEIFQRLKALGYLE